MNKNKTLILLLTTALLTANLAHAEELPPSLGDTTSGVTMTTSSGETLSTTTTDTESTPVTTALPTTTSAKPAFQEFTDVPVNHPNYNAILLLRYQGVISGYADNTFHPDQPLNRVEALKLVFEVANLDFNTGIAPAKFTDTIAGAWYATYLNKAVFLEVVGGYPDGSFKPERSVNLVEFLKMLLIAQKTDLMGLKLMEIPYADAEPGQWYSKYLVYAKTNKLLDADANNNVYPDRPVTRAQAAEIIYRYRNLLAKQSQQVDDAKDDNTSSTVPSPVKLDDTMALFVSPSYKFAMQYPEKWFYSSVDSITEGAIRTYAYGPKDLETNPGLIYLELLPASDSFKANLEYEGKLYQKSELSGGDLALTTKVTGSTRLYRLRALPEYEQVMLKMMASLTHNIEGLEPVNNAVNTNTTTTPVTTP
ncbi:S-layer homology domain-containing protein [Candidatus Peregrinibacteria bacterium]|nr:S-layer homology domain-containing protein [Candidatus Peregrinibacteria bacterium]